MNQGHTCYGEANVIHEGALLFLLHEARGSAGLSLFVRVLQFLQQVIIRPLLFPFKTKIWSLLLLSRCLPVPRVIQYSRYGLGVEETWKRNSRHGKGRRQKILDGQASRHKFRGVKGRGFGVSGPMRIIPLFQFLVILIFLLFKVRAFATFV